MNELNLIKLKNLLLDKEFCIANANRDLAVGDRWTTGWDHLMEGINIEIDKFSNLLNF